MVLNEVLTNYFEVEEKASSPEAGVQAVLWEAGGLQSTPLKMFVHLCNLAALLTDGGDVHFFCGWRLISPVFRG